MRKVGGLYFFKLGLFGGSIYLNKPALVATANYTLLYGYVVVVGYYGTALFDNIVGI